MFAPKILKDGKKSTNGFHHFKPNLAENTYLEYEQYQMKLKLWKFVANENRVAKIGELSSVKSLFCRYLDRIMSLKEQNDYNHPSFWTEE